MPLFEYPPFDFSVTEKITNLDLGNVAPPLLPPVLAPERATVGWG